MGSYLDEWHIGTYYPGIWLIVEQTCLTGGVAVYVPQAMIEQYALKVGDDIFALVQTPKDVLQEENYELLCITAINSVNVSTLPVPDT